MMSRQWSTTSHPSQLCSTPVQYVREYLTAIEGWLTSRRRHGDLTLPSMLQAEEFQHCRECHFSNASLDTKRYVIKSKMMVFIANASRYAMVNVKCDLDIAESFNSIIRRFD